MEIQTQATNVINQLKEVFLVNQKGFDFQVSVYISGNSNKLLRQEIAKQLTGEVKPFSQCGMYAISDLLTASFMQYQLF